MLPFFPAFVPNLLQAAPFALAFCFLCARPLRAHPGPFYALWGVAAVAAFWHDPAAAPPALDAVMQLLTSAYTGVCLYFVVMFAGALERTPAVKRLLSIRSELSVIAGIIIAGHLVRVIDFLVLSLTPMWEQIWGQPAAGIMFAAAVVVGLPLTATFLVPWITSFKCVRRRLSQKAWKRTQLLAYPFVLLMAAQGFLLAVGHLLHGYPYDGQQTLFAIMADPSAWLATFAQQVATAWLYLALGVGYVVLRLRKRARDRARREKALAEAAAC
ncbi:hypothetical protein [Arabiibacter massiliensis]|uniref:hypothetical protein n=1 Tax=Arabiibacter massiliensis TaxID=1870985 RepID=UPI0009BAD114|nr:hypothetical protein [Arabiibacter massiliensis]